MGDMSRVTEESSGPAKRPACCSFSIYGSTISGAPRHEVNFRRIERGNGPAKSGLLLLFDVLRINHLRSSQARSQVPVGRPAGSPQPPMGKNVSESRINLLAQFSSNPRRRNSRTSVGTRTVSRKDDRVMSLSLSTT